MIIQIMKAIQNADSAINLDSLSRELDVERSALEGMLGTLVNTGQLSLNQDVEKLACETVGGCAGCASANGCAFTMRMPNTYTLFRPASSVEKETKS